MRFTANVCRRRLDARTGGWQEQLGLAANSPWKAPANHDTQRGLAPLGGSPNPSATGIPSTLPRRCSCRQLADARSSFPWGERNGLSNLIRSGAELNE